MASNQVRLPQRSRLLPGRVKADENAAGRHVRQLSGIHSSRTMHKDSGITKASASSRAALGDKENAIRLVAAKGKDDPSLKRGRSNSTTIEQPPQRVAFGFARSQVVRPISNATRIPTTRNPSRTIHVHTDAHMERAAVATTVIADEDVELDEVEMIDVRESVTPYEDEMEELEVQMEVEDLAPEPAGPFLWPSMTPQRAAVYERYVADVQRSFVDNMDEEDDPSMVSEYAEEIFQYMAELELQVLPDASYDVNQPELTWVSRQEMIDWLLQVHMTYHLVAETLWIAINIVDRFLSVRVISRNKLQLVGLASLFIACKYEEIMSPALEEFASMAGDVYSKEDLLKAERIILSSLGFHISHYCSPYSWMRKISRADEYNLHTRTLSKFLVELTLMDHRFLAVKPSMLAAVGMYSSKIILGGEWDDAFVAYSGYTKEQLSTGHQYILETLLHPNIQKFFVFRKYSNKRFMKVATYAHSFAMHSAGRG